jgi:Cft2 family RNA processing exonuclease
MARTAEESKAINAHDGAGIVIASSGMMNGGRILHHLARRLPDPRTTVLVAGFQASGTRGRMLIEGAEFLTIHGRDIPVRAAVRRVDALSGHGDRHEIGRWLSSMRAPRRVFLVHGEPPAARGKAEHLKTTLGWELTVSISPCREAGGLPVASVHPSAPSEYAPPYGQATEIPPPAHSPRRRRATVDPHTGEDLQHPPRHDAR